MDGTLLDKYFDDYFWEHYVPEVFAELNNLSPDEARSELLSRYRQVESTLQWTDLDYWSEQLGLDIPELKCRIDHLIQVHPYVIDFLSFHQTQRERRSISSPTPIPRPWRSSCARPVSVPIFHGSSAPRRWERPRNSRCSGRNWKKCSDFDKARTLLADDTASVLSSARQYGMGYLISIARPSSQKPVSYSDEFPSIANFQELIF